MKVSIIGAGAVGVGICNYLLSMGDCREIVIVDLNRERSEGEQMDFSHVSALSFAKNTRIVAGDYPDISGSDVVVITAGAQIKKGQDRLELAAVNAPIAVDIAKKTARYAPEAVVIVVTNPCDILAYFIIANTPLAPQQVISAGCVIDSARLMKIIADRVGLDPKNIFGMVWGEHGSNSVIPWSAVQVAGQSLDDYCEANGLPPFDKDELLAQTKQAGLEIFSRKMNTNHGIAGSVFRIIRAIGINEHSVLPVGVLLQGEYGLRDVVLNVPVVINSSGIERIVRYRLPADELVAVQKSAQQLRQVIEQIAKETGLMK
ncbi:MAG: hypothetical protein Q4G28_11970 [Neisseria sp.]|nr:hypothetical protein [Neisseria sp.]